MGKNDISAINIPDFMHQECCHISSCEESPTPVWLNNSLSLYCTVTHCVTYSLDPSHLLTYISTEFGCMATYDLNSLAPSFTQYEYCNDFGSSKVECVSQLPNMYGTQLCLLQSPAIPQECAPWHSEGYFSGVMWHEWMNLVARVTTTLAVRSCRQFIAKNPLKVLSSWWFTARSKVGRPNAHSHVSLYTQCWSPADSIKCMFSTLQVCGACTALTSSGRPSWAGAMQTTYWGWRASRANHPSTSFSVHNFTR